MRLSESSCWAPGVRLNRFSPHLIVVGSAGQMVQAGRCYPRCDGKLRGSTWQKNTCQLSKDVLCKP